ncbi:MAG: MGMT family protein [Candidatus Omnitrophota bacterium]|jgi:O-6-methylguanine DNA methyltransferase
MKKRQRRSTTISEFRQRVYDAVSRIPEAETRTYKDIATEIGCPRAWRAVGNALNKNPSIGLIPCHRVIRSDGSIGGFVNGVRAKRRLLRLEALNLGRDGSPRRGLR